MAGKTIVGKSPLPTAVAKKPGPKPRDSTQPGSGGKDIPKTGFERSAPEPTFETVVEVASGRKVFLESMAHALIFDVFQMPTVLFAIRDIDGPETEYFLDFYASRLRPLLIEDNQAGDIGALLDLGVWYALDGQEEILTEGLLRRLGGDVHATPQQVKELTIEAVYGAPREERPSRGERWLPALHRNGSRASTRTGGDNRYTDRAR